MLMLSEMFVPSEIHTATRISACMWQSILISTVQVAHADQIVIAAPAVTATSGLESSRILGRLPYSHGRHIKRGQSRSEPMLSPTSYTLHVKQKLIT